MMGDRSGRIDGRPGEERHHAKPDLIRNRNFETAWRS